MEFLAILIVLGLLQLWGSGGIVQKDSWFGYLIQSLKRHLGAGPWRLLLIVALPCLVLLLLGALVHGWLFGLVSLALAVVVLLYSLGRGDLRINLSNYLNSWNQGNFESAYEQAKLIGDFHQSESIDNYETLHEHLRRAFFYAGFERWFAVIFWFVLLGPVGALGYRLSYFCGRNESLEEAERLIALRWVHYLDWLPARLLAFSFALTGNFVNCFNSWQVLKDNQPTSELLDNCGMAALNGVNEPRLQVQDQEHFIVAGREELLAAQSLLSRSVVCWLLVIALMQLVAF